MALTFTICKRRDSSYRCNGSFGQNGRRLTTTTVTTNWLVQASDPADPNFDATKVEEAHVACWSALPRVQRDTYYNPVTNLSMPWGTCMAKTVRRRAETPLLFDVEAQYATRPSEVEECFVAPPDSLTSLTPQVTAAISSTERVLYTDFQGEDCYLLPGGIGEPFEAPTTTTDGRLTITVTQFEDSISFESLLARSHKVNSVVYRGRPAGHWRIGSVQAAETTVQLASGPYECVRVSYPISLSDDVIINGDGSQLKVGHNSTQPLVSYWHMNEGEKTPFKDAVTGFQYAGYINQDGTKNDAATRPEYVVFDTTIGSDFSFLQA